MTLYNAKQMKYKTAIILSWNEFLDSYKKLKVRN